MSNFANICSDSSDESQAEKRLVEKGWNGVKQKEYAGIVGIKEFNDASVRFAYGADSPAIKENRVRFSAVHVVPPAHILFQTIPQP